MHLGIGLVERLQIGLLGDALSRERAAELVVHHLHLLVDQDVRQLDGRVGDRVVDDPVGELVACPVERVALESRPDIGAQLLEVCEIAERADEVVVELGLDLLAQLAELDREVGLLAGQLGLGVVVGERDVELGRATDLETQQVRLEPGDQPLLAEDQGHALGAATLERLAVARSRERDDRVVAVLGAAALDRGERRVLVTQLLEDLVDAGVVDRLDLGSEVEVLVVAELDLGRDLDGRLEDERLALLGLDDLDIGVRQRQEVLLDHGFAICVTDQVLDRLVENGARAEMALENRSGGLARPEARHARPARQATDRVVDGAAEPLGRQLDLEQDGDSGPGVEVICIAQPVYGGARQRAAAAGAGAPCSRIDAAVVGERGIEPPRRFRGTGS